MFQRSRNEIVSEEKNRVLYKSDNADITAVLRIQDDTKLAILNSNGQVHFVDLFPNIDIPIKTTTTTLTSTGLELAKTAVQNRITQVRNEALDKQRRYQDTVKVIEALEHSVLFDEEFQWPLHGLNNMVDGKPMLNSPVQRANNNKHARFNEDNRVNIERAWFHGPMACIAVCITCSSCEEEKGIDLLLVPPCKSYGGKWQKLEGNRIAAWTMLDLNVAPASRPTHMQYIVDVMFNLHVIGSLQVDLDFLLQSGWICLDTKLEEKPPFPLFTAEESINVLTSQDESMRISASSPARMLALIRQLQRKSGAVTRDWKACNGLANAQRIIDALKPNNNNDEDDEAVAELLCLLQENDYYFDQ